MLEEFSWEERGYEHSHHLTCVILSEEQGKQICAYYIIGIKYKQSFYQIENDYDMKEHVKITILLNYHKENEANT